MNVEAHRSVVIHPITSQILSEADYFLFHFLFVNKLHRFYKAQANFLDQIQLR